MISEETSPLRRGSVDGELSQQEICDQLLKFISTNFLFDGQGTVNREDRLFEEGIIDSLGVLELLELIEQSYSIIVKDSDVVLDNFGSVEAMVEYVVRASKEAPDE